MDTGVIYHITGNWNWNWNYSLGYLDISSFEFWRNKSMSFLDQFYNYVWAYPIRGKSETFSKYLHFSAYIWNQYGVLYYLINMKTVESLTTTSFFLNLHMKARRSGSQVHIHVNKTDAHKKYFILSKTWCGQLFFKLIWNSSFVRISSNMFIFSLSLHPNPFLLTSLSVSFLTIMFRMIITCFWVLMLS